MAICACHWRECFCVLLVYSFSVRFTSRISFKVGTQIYTQFIETEIKGYFLVSTHTYITYIYVDRYIYDCTHCRRYIIQSFKVMRGIAYKQIAFGKEATSAVCAPVKCIFGGGLVE